MQKLCEKKGCIYDERIKREEAAKENCLRSFRMTIRMCACHVYSYNENVARPFFFRAIHRRPDRLGQPGSLHPAKR